MAQKIIITGAAGHAGQILQSELGTKYRFERIDRVADQDLVDKQVDLQDIVELTKAFQCSADAVVHLAASAEVSSPWKSVLDNNITGAYHAFEAARQAGIKKIVFASTNHVTGYEEITGQPCDSNTLPRPDSLYGCSKAFGESLARYYADSFGIHAVCLRIGSLRQPEVALQDERCKKTWLSPRDFAGMVSAILQNNTIRFGIYYAISGNTEREWDIDSFKNDFGYSFQDNAEILWQSASGL